MDRRATNSRLYSLRVEDDHNLKVHRWGYSATTLLGQNVGLGLISSYQYIWNASLIFVLNALVRFVLAFYAETLHEISVSKNVGPFFCKFLFLPNCALLYFFQLNFKFLLEPNSTLKPLLWSPMSMDIFISFKLCFSDFVFWIRRTSITSSVSTSFCLSMDEKNRLASLIIHFIMLDRGPILWNCFGMEL